MFLFDSLGKLKDKIYGEAKLEKILSILKSYGRIYRIFIKKKLNVPERKDSGYN